jgi:hypothetical protein
VPGSAPIVLGFFALRWVVIAALATATIDMLILLQGITETVVAL